MILSVRRRLLLVQKRCSNLSCAKHPVTLNLCQNFMRQMSPIYQPKVYKFHSTSFSGGTLTELSKSNLESNSLDKSVRQRLNLQLCVVMSTIHNNFTSTSLDRCTVSKTKTPEGAESDTVSVLAPEGVCRSLQVVPAFVSLWMCPVSGWDQLCLCVSVWLELKGHSRGAMVLGLDWPWFI